MHVLNLPGLCRNLEFYTLGLVLKSFWQQPDQDLNLDTTTYLILLSFSCFIYTKQGYFCLPNAMCPKIELKPTVRRTPSLVPFLFFQRAPSLQICERNEEPLLFVLKAVAWSKTETSAFRRAASNSCCCRHWY